MKYLKLILVAAALSAVAALTPKAKAIGTNLFQPGRQPSISAFGGANVITVCSNMTTNITCGAAILERGQGVAICASFRSVTNEATALKILFEYSTNKAGSTATNWFRPMPPPTALTFSNNSDIAVVRQVAFIPPTAVDNLAQLRPYSFQNTSTTNNITNLVLSASVLVP